METVCCVARGDIVGAGRRLAVIPLFGAYQELKGKRIVGFDAGCRGMTGREGMHIDE